VSESAATTTEPTTRPSGEREAGGVPIVLDGVTKKYPGTDSAAVDDIHLDIAPGDIVMLVGPSGCGKTTTMRMINRLIEPTSGRILIDGEDVLSLNDVKLRRTIGYVIQQIGLFPHLTIESNVSMVPKLLGWDKARIATRVEEMLSVVGLDPAEFAHRYPRQLSGGQQQRVGVARALCADPPIMLMDEPFGAVDPITRTKLQDEFLNLQQRLHKTIVFVTHDFDEAVKMGDKIAVLDKGSRIAQYASPEEILTSPADDFVSGFVGHGATLKRLQLERLDSLDLHPADVAEQGVEPLPMRSTLHDVLDAMIADGLDAVQVVDDGHIVGTVTLEDLLGRVRELRAEADARTGGAASESRPGATPGTTPDPELEAGQRKDDPT
jgi:osmoprotectant transport system ATP-binding protein